jgi:cell division transport system ATP-binding protein
MFIFELNCTFNLLLMPQDFVIQFENVSIFQDDHLVLSGINFTLNRSEFVYLIGRVGSGKSSIIKTINS